MSQMLATRVLQESDVLRLGAPRGSTPEPIEKTSHRHHALARCLALGMKAAEASLATGYSLSRISILQRDELFAELVSFYKAEMADVFKSTAEQLEGLSIEALSALRDRLEDDPTKISTKDLVDVAKLAADRSGHGPQSTQTNLNINLSERMAAARKRVEPPIIEGVVE